MKLEVRDLSKSFGENEVLHGISFSVESGNALGLLGRNGAGKTTTIRILMNVFKGNAGSVLLDGKPFDPAKHQIGYMPEERGLYPKKTVSEQLIYLGMLRGLSAKKAKENMKKWLAIMEVSEYENRKLETLSKGNQQKVQLAQTLITDPKIIILDEPTSFLDIRHKLELLTILKDMVSQKNVAVIMSLHELDLAQKISDQVICVHGSAIERYGEPEDIFTSEYIKKLYGVTKGSYNADFGCLELEPPSGTPEVFVIAGNGSGIPVFRKLQRKGIPFAAGVLHENDVDCQVAKALAAEVVTEKAFCEISTEAYEKARKIMNSCKKVICCVQEYGPMNEKNRLLEKEARENGDCV